MLVTFILKNSKNVQNLYWEAVGLLLKGLSWYDLIRLKQVCRLVYIINEMLWTLGTPDIPGAYLLLISCS